MNKNIKQSIIYVTIVLGLSFLVFWGPLTLLKLKTANLVEGKIYNPIAFIIFVIGGFVPSIVGVVLTFIFEGRQGLRLLFKSSINIRIGFRSLIIIIGYALVLVILQLLLYRLLGGVFDYSQFIKQLPSILPLMILGPISEEFGWRGFLQKKLNKDFSPIVISIIVGVVWSLWHLPLFFMVGTSQHEFNIPFISFLISITSSAFIFTYIYNKSKESLFSAIMLHWIVTYILQVISSNVIRTSIYNIVEFIPSFLICTCIIIIMIMEKSNGRPKLTTPKSH